MRLKSIRLSGFKSFADRTVLEIGSGISVVVGPNGTGKSNIVDAVSWVLGSQFTKALRADQMEDVIFAGSSNRPALTRAEVTLVLDNSSRDLPLELDEVAITRRLYRGGNSEYEINGVACRLLDISELISEGGLGRSQHMIVGQGRLDMILGGSPARCREIIEDAAGILKHRVRRAKAVRRLERSEEDVVRLHDIVAELDRRRRPLRKQARDARRYQDMRSELRSLRVWLRGEELRSLAGQKQDLEDERQAIEVRIRERGLEYGKLKELVGSKEEEADRARVELEQEKEKMAGLRTVDARLHGVVQVAKERAGSLSERILEKERGHQALTGRVAAKRSDLEKATRQEQEARRVAEQRENELREAEVRLSEANERQKSSSEPDPASLRSELATAERDALRSKHQIKELHGSIAETRARIEKQVARIEGLEQDRVPIAEQVEEAYRRAEFLSGQIERREQVWRSRSERLRKAETDLVAASGRLEGLETLKTETRMDRGRPTDAEEVLGELISLLAVPEGLLKAVETALGVWVDAWVVGSRAAMKDLLAAAWNDRPAGSAPIVTARPDSMVDQARAVADRWGVTTLCDRLGSTDRAQPAEGVLGDVLVVETPQLGWEIVQDEPGLRAITLEGDLITGFGMAPAVAGSLDTLLSARRVVEEADRALEQARRTEAEARARLESARRQKETAERETRRLETRLASIGEQQDGSVRTQEELEVQLTGLENRLETTVRSAQILEVRLEELRDLCPTAAGEDQAESIDSGQYAALRRETAEKQQVAARAAWEQSIRILGGATERRRLLAEQSDSLTARLEQGIDIGIEQEGMDQAVRIEQEAAQIAGIVGRKLAELSHSCDRSSAAADRSGQELGRMRRHLVSLSETIEKEREILARLEVKATALALREEAVVEALTRDDDTTREAALSASPPPEQVEEPDARVEQLAKQLSRMGPINPLATEEFEKLDERHRELTDQLADLEQARAGIRRVISALDTEMNDLFMRTYEDTARHYQACFARLFPGGRGELSLVGSSDPLEAGVEIKAQPLGKKVGKLSLLSGGERALAALAFLFAVFKARPGPFHILDEVDAALDDANLGRFLRLVEDFRADGRLLMITHQQATVQVADTLYGVTMEPGGYTRVLVRDMNRPPLLDEMLAGADR